MIFVVPDLAWEKRKKVKHTRVQSSSPFSMVGKISKFHPQKSCVLCATAVRKKVILDVEKSNDVKKDNKIN